jgi:hypothetical protein
MITFKTHLTREGNLEPLLTLVEVLVELQPVLAEETNKSQVYIVKLNHREPILVFKKSVCDNFVKKPFYFNFLMP